MPVIHHSPHRVSRTLIHVLSALGLAIFVLAGSAAAATPYNNLLSRGRTEPSVAIDARHPSTIVVGSNPDYNTNGNLPVSFYTSHNGGRTFQSGTVPLRAPYTTAADPSVAIDRGGTVYYAFLGQTPAFCSVGHSAILLSTSRDGGRSFGSPIVVDVNRADDKPFMTIEDVAGGPSHVFVTWTRFHDKDSDIWYARSLDGGRTFSHSVMLYTSQTDNFGSLPVIGPGGHVYAFWSSFPDRPLSATSPARILMRASSDDGRRFAPVHSAVGRFWTIPQMMEPGSLRSLTAPTAASDRDGTLYLAWAAATRDHGGGVVDVDIMLSRSQNEGRQWSKATSVNDVHGGDRFMPALSVLADQSIGIAFYDRRSGPNTLDVYAVHASYAGGFHRTSNIRVNRASSPISDIYYIKPGSTCLASGRFFGDYMGTAASPDNSLCVSWADTQFHVYDETDLWLARVYFPAFAAVRSRLVHAHGRTGT